MCPESEKSKKPVAENKDESEKPLDLTIDGKDSMLSVPTNIIKEIKMSEKDEGDKRTQRARETLSFILVFGLIALFLCSFIFAGTVDEAIKLIQAISSALTGLIGAVLGYYFGTTTTPKTTETKQ